MNLDKFSVYYTLEDDFELWKEQKQSFEIYDSEINEKVPIERRDIDKDDEQEELVKDLVEKTQTEGIVENTTLENSTFRVNIAGNKHTEESEKTENSENIQSYLMQESNERKKLEESSASSVTSIEKSTSSSNLLISGSLSTKGKPSRELRNLLSDKAHNRKWINALYEGQEELCELLNKVLQQLKNYQEHSYPFLSRVRKSDAPDYYDIVKNPMDLGMMTKKLNRFEYPFIVYVRKVICRTAVH